MTEGLAGAVKEIPQYQYREVSMNTENIREGPEKDEGPWHTAKCSTTPDRPDANPQAAHIYDIDFATEAQTPAAEDSLNLPRTRSNSGG